jgi:hypothetical protein
MRHLRLCILGLALGCGSDTKPGGESSGDDTGVGGGSTDISAFINVTDAPIGDLSCFNAADGLGRETAADGCVAQRSMSGLVSDFQLGSPVDDAEVEIFLSDSTAGPPDAIYVSDPNGIFSGEVNTCAPFTYRVTTDPLLDLTKVTIESHDVMPNMGPIIPTHEVNSVSSVTYSLIPRLLGVNPDLSKGIVAGRAYDCAGQNLEGLQVVVRDAAGVVPEDTVAKYFVDDFPKREQMYTSADGLWIIMDVPPGTWTVEGYVADGAGGWSLVAATELNVVADSINISSIYTGISDGVKMPPECLTACN